MRRLKSEEKERLEAEAKKRGEGKKAPKVSIPKEKLINKLKSQLELNRDNFGRETRPRVREVRTVFDPWEVGMQAPSLPKNWG